MRTVLCSGTYRTRTRYPFDGSYLPINCRPYSYKVPLSEVIPSISPPSSDRPGLSLPLQTQGSGGTMLINDVPANAAPQSGELGAMSIIFDTRVTGQRLGLYH